jgi:hypothetical protein
MPGLDEYLAALTALIRAAAAAGWGGTAAIVSSLVAAFAVYFQGQRIYKKYIEDENRRRAQKAQAQNSISNRADELASQKAEDEIEALIKGGPDANPGEG